MNASKIAEALLENEDDFDLVDELDNLPDRPKPWIQEHHVIYDADDDIIADDTDSPVYFNSYGDQLARDAVEYLNSAGACFVEPEFFDGVEYKGTVEEEERAGHFAQSVWKLGNFTEEEQRSVYDAMTGKAHP